MQKETPGPVPASSWRKQPHLLEKSLLLVLIFSHIVVFQARFISIASLSWEETSDVPDRPIQLEQIEMLKPPPPPPPPPKTLQVQPQIVVPDEVPDKITTPIKPIPERRRRRPRSTEKVTLDLAANTDVHLATQANITLAAKSSPFSKRGAMDAAPDLDAGLSVNLELNPTAGSGLDLEAKRSVNKNTDQEPDHLSLELSEPQALKKAETESRISDADFLNADVSLILASNDLSMGIEEYQLWNRINAEFDRWDKGRYGPLPRNMRRKGRALIASFRFQDKTHTIVWLRGNTKIYISGGRSPDRISELKEALRALIHLNIQRNGNL